MSIRSAAKAVVVNDGKILLNACRDRHNGEYYSLPGGGQNQYEPLRDTVVRECLEETGYTVVPVRLVTMCEQICLDEAFRRTHPDYAHRILHIFLCALADNERKAPTEEDSAQVACEWVDILSLDKIRLLPTAVGEHIDEIVDGSVPPFLGTEFLAHNHG